LEIVNDSLFDDKNIPQLQNMPIICETTTENIYNTAWCKQLTNGKKVCHSTFAHDVNKSFGTTSAACIV